MTQPTVRLRVLFSSVLMLGCSLAIADQIDPNYEHAIRDTAVMKSKNVHTLSQLGTGPEQFIVWTDYPSYQPNNHYVMPINLFVTRIDEMKSACHKLARVTSSSKLQDKINQLLGLPETNKPRRFVQLTMNVEQPNNGVLANYSNTTVGQALFRPCGNPDVHAAACGTDFADGVTDEFKLWIYQKTRQSYHESTVDPATQQIHYGYPWTDLGYTYNWGTNNHVGLTEFVVKKGAEVQVQQQADGSAYLDASTFCK